MAYMRIKNKQTPFLWLACAIFFTATLPGLFSFGMGGDGQIYSAIALNMAEGLGSLWQPYFSATMFSKFYEHPPLAIWMQAQLFKLFGDHNLVEKIYSLSTHFVIAGFIIYIWRRFIFKQDTLLRDAYWIPLLFWFCLPEVSHSLRHDYLENTLGVFTLASAVTLLLATQSRYWVVWVLLSGIAVVGAILSKGPVGLFPLAFITLYKLTLKDITLFRTTMLSLLLIVVITITMWFILLDEHARNSILQYLNGQLFEALRDGRGKARGTHFYIIGRIFIDVLLPLIFALGIFRYFSRNYRNEAIITTTHYRWASLFFLVGISASVPSMVSLKQDITYIAPSFPYFAISAAIFAALWSRPWLENLNQATRGYRIVAIASLSAMLGIILYSLSNLDRLLPRQAEITHDMRLYGAFLKPRTTIGLCDSDYLDIDSFMMRYYRISLDAGPAATSHPLYLGTKNCSPNPGKRYVKIDAKTKYFILYKQDTPSSH